MNKSEAGSAQSIYLHFFSPVYSALWRIARPFLAKHKRLQQGFSCRLVPKDWVQPFNFGLTIWIQAASGGEAYLLVRLWKQLQKDYRGEVPIRILGTTCTKQGMEVMEHALSHSLPAESGLPGGRSGAPKLSPNGVMSSTNSSSQSFDVAADINFATGPTTGPNSGPAANFPQVSLEPAYFPLDQPGLMQKALKLATPSLVCLLETELWPGLLMAAHEKNIPVLLLNGRITPKSLAGYKLLPGSFWRALAPKQILAISRSDAERFGELFETERTELMPNIKFDLLLENDPKNKLELTGPIVESPTAESPETTSPDPTGLKLSAPPLVVFGSVRKQEAKAVAAAVVKLQALNSNCLIVLAPRHLHHVHVWQRQLKLAGAQPILLSQIKGSSQLKPDTVLHNFATTPSGTNASFRENTTNALTGTLTRQVIIWNKFGELKKLYAQAAAVFVGGSLAPLGGQNFLEVLEFGIQPCIGPHWSNFAWAGKEILGLVKKVNNPQELALALSEQLANPAKREEVKASLHNFVAAHKGGAKIAAQTIMNNLPN